ncbi:MAG TPA: energy transducer TonB [Verrucomicrobiae bacterium]|nr:energy transducer TonB [Verrucomicrobiae bacterium]
MNRLQKKCIIATVGLHLLLLTLLLVGPAFFNHQPKTTETQLLDVIPANLVENALNSGVQNAQPPPPQPPQAQVQPPQPTPPPPKPVVAPAPVPTPEKIAKIKPEPVKPPKPALSSDDLKPVRRTTPRTTRTQQTDNRDEQLRKMALSAVRNLRHDFKPGTVVDVPGTGNVSSANYKDALASIYYDAWTTPEGGANDEANTTVRITVATDGTVINARILTPSSDPKVDASVQRALERVRSVPPLPDQSKAQQDFTILFNLQTKRMSE